MLSLMYVSVADGMPDDADLVAILTVACQRNVEFGVTGLLVYRNGRFMQLLEGPDDAVEDRFARIAADSRHTDIQVLGRNAVASRWFPDWSMAFQPSSDGSTQQLPGFSDFFTRNGAASEAGAPARIRAVLHWFRHHPLAVPAPVR